MNDFFNIRRFGRLLKKQVEENYRHYLMYVSVLTGVLVLGGAFLFFLVNEPPDTGFQLALYAFLMFLSGSIFTATIFSDWGDRRKAITAMLFPATVFEKFLVAWLISFVFFAIVYTGVFYLALFSLSAIKHWTVSTHFSILSLSDKFLNVGILFSFFHAAAFFGSIYFNRLHFVKTAFMFFVTYGALVIANTFLLKLITGVQTLRPSIPFGSLNFDVDKRNVAVDVKISGIGPIWLFFFGLSMLIWAASYFRLKEKQA